MANPFYIVKVYADRAEEWNCSEWRDLAVADAINASGRPGWRAKLVHVSGFTAFLDPAIQDTISGANIITVQRNMLTPEVMDAMQYWRGRGIPVVADLDDAYPLLPSSNPAHNLWINNSIHADPPPLVMLERSLSVCDGLTSPNRLILQDWSHVVKGYFLPNLARREWWTNLPSRVDRKAALGLSDRIVIGWGGSVSHYDSWWGSHIMDAARVIARRYPQVVFMICGGDSRIYQQLPVPSDNKFYQVPVLPRTWPTIVRSFDIGVAPLYGPYDQRRSWNKVVENALAGNPTIASLGEPYYATSHLANLIENSVDNWVAGLSHAIENLADAQAISAGLIPKAQYYFVDNHLDIIYDTFNKIISSFHARVGTLPGVYFVNWKQKTLPKVKSGNKSDKSDKSDKGDITWT